MYKSSGEAVNSSQHDGIIVLGVFVEVGEHNAEFEKILKSFPHIQLKSQAANLKEQIDYKKLFPSIDLFFI